MSHFRLLGAFLTTAAALAGSGPAIGMETTGRGAFSVTLTIVSGANIPLQTKYYVATQISTSGAHNSQSKWVQPWQVTKTSVTQVVTFSVPFRWTIDGPLSRRATVRLSVYAWVGSPGEKFEGQLSFSAPLPSNNAATPVAATIRL